MNELVQGLESYKNLFVSVGLSIIRLLAVSSVVTFLDNQSLPGRARTSVALALSLLLVPMVQAQLPTDPLSSYEYTGIVVKEIILGVMIGFFFSLPFRVAEGVGVYIDNQRGTGFAAIFNPLSGEQVSPLGILLLQMTIVLFLIGGGMEIFLDIVYSSYQVWPLFDLLPDFSVLTPQITLGSVDHLVRAIVILSAPAIIAMFLSELGLGIMNQFAQQLNVFSLSLPVKSGVGLFMLLIYFPFLSSAIHKELQSTKEVLETVFQILPL